MTKRSIRRAAAGALGLWLFGIAGDAEAAPPAPSSAPKASGDTLSNEMQAERLFRSGEKKFDAGQYAEACNDFAHSLRFGPKLGALLNLALCHETVGKLATAWREFQYSAAWAAQNGQRDRRDFAVQHATALEAKLPRVLFQLPSDHAIASVEIDGEPLPEVRWFLPVFLDAGEHSVAVTAPGKQRGTVSFRVTSSPTEQVVIVTSLADATVPTTIVTAQDPHRTRRIAGYATLGAGAASTLVGLTFGAIFLAKRPSDCGSACGAADARDERDASNAGVVSTVALGAGVVLGAVGTALILISQPTKETRVVASSPGSFSFGVLPGGGSASWTQTF